MATPSKRKLNAPTKSKDGMKLRVPVNMTSRDVIQLVRTSNAINQDFRRLTDMVQYDTTRNLGIALAMHFVAHVMSGGAVDDKSLRELAKLSEPVDPIASALSAGMEVDADLEGVKSAMTGSSRSGKLNLSRTEGPPSKYKDKILFERFEPGGITLTNLTRSNSGRTATSHPLKETMDKATEVFESAFQSLKQEAQQGNGRIRQAKLWIPNFSKRNQEDDCYEVPVVREAGKVIENAAFVKLKQKQQEIAERALDTKAAEFYKDKYAHLSPEEAAERRQQDEIAAKKDALLAQASDHVFYFVNRRIIEHAYEAAKPQIEKYGTAAVTKDGEYHPYAVRKSVNHEGLALLKAGVRIPEEGNYFYQKGIDANGNYDQSLSLNMGYREIRDELALKFPNLDPSEVLDKFHSIDNNTANLHRTLSKNTMVSEAGTKVVPDLILPIVGINGEIYGGQRISNDAYSLKTRNEKMHMRGSKLTQNAAFIDLSGKGIDKDTRILISGEGPATAESLAVLLLGKDYHKAPGVSVVAFVDSNGLKTALPKLDQQFLDTFKTKTPLTHVVAIDNDYKTIEPFNPKSGRTRENFENNEFNDYGVKKRSVPENAGRNVYKSLAADPALSIGFVTVPTGYLQKPLGPTVKDREIAVKHKNVDINDLVATYGLDKAREIAAAQIQNLPLSINKNHENSNDLIHVQTKSTPFEASLRDAQVLQAFQMMPESQQQHLDDIIQKSRYWNEAFRNKTIRGFVKDYVDSVPDIQNKDQYAPVRDLVKHFPFLDRIEDMHTQISPKHQSDALKMVASIHLHTPTVEGDFQKLSEQLRSMATDTDIGSKYPQLMGSVVNAINRIIVNNVDVKDSELTKMYEDFRTTNYGALDILTYSYGQKAIEHVQATKERTPDQIASYRATLEDKRLNVIDVVRSREAPEIIEQQIPKDQMQKLSPVVVELPPQPKAAESEKKQEVESPSIGM